MILPTYPRLVPSYEVPAQESRVFCCGRLLNAVGPSGFAPTRPYVDLLHWSFLPRPMKEWPHGLLSPWTFREVFYPFNGPGGYLSPQVPSNNGRTIDSPEAQLGYLWTEVISTCTLCLMTIGQSFGPYPIPKYIFSSFFYLSFYLSYFSSNIN
jgi:hypothetical protein